MNTKLTLNIDQNVIEEAKYYAKNNSISLSKLIENYLLSLTNKKTEKSKVSPLVASLTGVIAIDNNDYKKETANNSEFKPMTISEFHNRIEKSTTDSKNGKVTDVEDLLSEIEKWR